MKYCILGAGSVGGYFGARLQEAGEDVTFLVRPGRKSQLEKNGLIVRSYLGDVKLRVNAEISPESVGRCDVVVISVRNYNINDSVFDNVKYFIRSGAKVVSLLNGVEHMEKLRLYVPDEQIIGGSAFIDSRLNENGEIVHRGQEPTITLGSISGKIAGEIRVMASSLRKSGVKVIVTPDLMKALWRKYLFVMMGTITGIADADIGTLTSNEWLNHTLENVAYEMRAVASLESVDLDRNTINEMVEEIRGMRKEWKSLLTEDLENGKETELDSLWGYLIRKEKQYKLDLPVSNLVYGILKLREERKLMHH